MSEIAAVLGAHASIGAPPAGLGRRPVGPEGLDLLRSELRAARVGLLGFDHAGGRFEVVTAVGRPFLASGVKLPIAASAIVEAAGEGRRALRSTATCARPLDRLADFLGFRASLGLPLTVAGAVVGALTVFWDADPPPIDDPWRAVTGNELELVRLLVSPDAGEPRVLICHEQRLIAEGLARVAEQRLGATADIACTLAGALAALDQRSPDLIVLSDHLCPQERTPQLARRLRAAGAGAPLLAVARNRGTLSFETALQAGASGYLPETAAAERLPGVAATLLEGRTVLEQPGTGRTAPQLTEREQDVLMAFDRGLCDKEIARELGVAVSTVKTHARAIYAKLEAPSRTAALHRARATGLI